MFFEQIKRIPADSQTGSLIDSYCMRRANARNAASFRNSLQWPINVITFVDKITLCCNALTPTQHRSINRNLTPLFETRGIDRLSD